MADLTRSEAWELLTKYNKEPFHLRHALTVEGIMKYFAKELGYADEADFWAQVGLLHDLDFEGAVRYRRAFGTDRCRCHYAPFQKRYGPGTEISQEKIQR